MWTNYIKPRIDYTWKNKKYSCYDERDETVNNIMSECSKLGQKELKTRHDWIGKVIHWELCKGLKFDHTDQQCVHKPESIREKLNA